MAFDACMIAAVAYELNQTILGARVEKIHQPEKDELILLLHRERETVKLSVNASANSPRMNLTAMIKENPKSAPMFCMLLRKHLTGAKITAIRQIGFERIIELEFDAYDDLGFLTKKYLIAEIMGKYSNIIFCDKDKKVLSAVKIVDFTTSQKRQVLPGMTYELPPPQDKANPLETTKEQFVSLYAKNPNMPPDKFITTNFLGISTLTAREIACHAGGNPDAERLWYYFHHVLEIILQNIYVPTLIRENDGRPLEYSFMPIRQYGSAAVTSTAESFGQLIDEFFGTREKSERIKQRSNDIVKLLTNAEARLQKKIALQEADLRASAEKDVYKLYGDIITSNMYLLERGMEKAAMVNYYSEEMETVEIELDSRLTPSQNAQRYYKRYNKAKATQIELTRQLEIAKNELMYLDTIFDALTKAESESDLNEIRRELHESGYASRMKDYGEYSAFKKNTSVKPMEFMTDGGYRLLCGKNNSQNDYVTTKAASKYDYWFHVKNAAGSHVIMLCDGEEPGALDFTQAATVAAYYSQLRGGENVPVDYTHAKNVKKPNASKPGFVTYSTNWTAYVTPSEDVVKALERRGTGVTMGAKVAPKPPPNRGV